MNSQMNLIAEIVEHYFQIYLSIGYKYNYDVANFCKFVFTGSLNNRLLFDYDEFKNRFFDNGMPLDLIGQVIRFWDTFENPSDTARYFTDYLENSMLYLNYANDFNTMNTRNIDTIYMKLICYIDFHFKSEMRLKELNGELSEDDEEYIIKMVFVREGAEDCCICFENSFTTTTCGHSICNSCSTELYESCGGQPNCPLCRNVLELEVYNN